MAKKKNEDPEETAAKPKVSRKKVGVEPPIGESAYNAWLKAQEGK
jgi:hypothetical protein